MAEIDKTILCTKCGYSRELHSIEPPYDMAGPDSDYCDGFSYIPKPTRLDLLRAFVEQAQYICELPTGPEPHDVSKLRKLGKLAFPFGAKSVDEDLALAEDVLKFWGSHEAFGDFASLTSCAGAFGPIADKARRIVRS